LITFVYIFLNIWLKITKNGSQKTFKRNFIHWGEEMRYKDDDKMWTHSGNNRALFQWAFNAKCQQSSSIWILGHLINRSSNVCSDELKSCGCKYFSIIEWLILVYNNSKMLINNIISNYCKFAILWYQEINFLYPILVQISIHYFLLHCYNFTNLMLLGININEVVSVLHFRYCNYMSRLPSLRACFGPNMFTECTTCSNRTRIQLQTMLSYKIM
jgi:hypothetical protein